MQKTFYSTARSALGRVLFPFFTLLACIAAGCGTFSSIKRDPLAALGGNDKAPLPVVVQRAEAASITATEVDRLLTATPVGNDSPWPQQTQLSDEAISTFENALADHPYYDATPFHICPAIIWADGLAPIGHDRASSSALESSSSADASSNAEVSSSVSPDASADASADATMPKPTAAPGASAATSTVPAATMRPSLLAAISSELAAGYAGLQARIQHVASLKAQQKAEELAEDRKDLSDAEKKKHEAAAESLSAQADKADDEVDNAKDAYVASCRAAAEKVPADVRDHFVLALSNLRQAVHDANAANAAAAIRYAELVPEIVSQPLRLKDVLIQVAKANVSDYIFEQTGKRVKLSSLRPAVTFENGKVSLVLAGLEAGDLMNLKFDELLMETIARTERFAGKAVTLYVTTSEAGEKLEFEGDVLDGILDGFKSSGCKTTDPTKIPDQTAKEIQARSSGALAKSRGFSFHPF